MALASALARDWKLDVSEDAGSTWVPVKGLSGVAPVFAGAMQDTSDIDSNGYGSKTSTGQDFSIPFSGGRKGDATTAFVDDPGQNILRRKGRKTGSANMVLARIYRRDDLPDAYQCPCAIEFTDAPATDPRSLQSFSGTLWGDGEPEEIAKPTSTGVSKTITRSAATAGSFTLSLVNAGGTSVTGNIPWNATALQVQSALEALPNVGEGNVNVTGAAGGPYVAKFSVAVTTLTGVGTGLTPSGTITVT
jgi:hypothetical protein